AFQASESRQLLQQNYPNPFSASTNIEFELSRAADVQLEILTITGQRIYQVQAHYDAGVHQIVVEGSLFPESGIYYYQIESEGYRQTRKMIFVRE
ncbi:MAG: T9SS type A sorting domain-containing protein, partial [Bacteroidota bacterium]